MKQRLIIFCAGFLFIIHSSQSQYAQNTNNKLDKLVDNAIEKSLSSLKNSVAEVKDPLLYPTYATRDLRWKLKSSSDWTSGFYPGCLWYAYQLSKADEFKK